MNDGTNAESKRSMLILNTFKGQKFIQTFLVSKIGVLFNNLPSIQITSTETHP